ncbi:unnamed protein product [Acanthoscelides obtectus]|uniref:Uncharacterized protein n=1 Tax=Acanthoscelides obtectus TaxID=200917 RepID=A0A9P0PZX8_ACAOB|nr:unnamed protein product [Acanthoscelides obtectus]CAK1628405.1 hypothetical protein AOBTE_LOCUS5191 [Acanthoscelides obtectus]
MPFWICQQTSGISGSKISSSTCREYFEKHKAI